MANQEDRSAWLGRPEYGKPREELRKAIENGDLPRIRSLCRAHPMLVDEQMGNETGSAVHYAIVHGKGGEKQKIAMLEVMVEPEINANLNATEVKWLKLRPLHQAVNKVRAYSNMVEWLLRHGADPNLPALDGGTPLMWASDDLNPVLVRILLDSGADQGILRGGLTPLHVAVNKSASSLEVVSLLLKPRKSDGKVIINAQENSGRTPLHFASSRNHVTIVQCLTDHGAELELVTVQGRTPLHFAAENGAFEAANELLRAGASTTRRNIFGKTPADLAKERGHLAIMELLLDADLAYGEPQQVNPDTFRVSTPAEDQRRVAESFQGLVWPSVKPAVEQKRNRYDRMTVADMLYGSEKAEARLKCSGRNNGARWIHIPSNNRTWIEDAFKVIFALEETGETPPQPNTDEEQHETASGRPLRRQRAIADLAAILRFVDEGFGHATLGSRKGRPPQFLTAPGLGGTYSKKHMFSLVMPILDVDMQMAFIYQPTIEKSETSRIGEQRTEIDVEDFKEHLQSRGQRLSDDQKRQVIKLLRLKQAYDGQINTPSSLDGYFHEFMSEQDLLARNDDQVVSRFFGLHRQRMSMTLANNSKTVAQDAGTSGDKNTSREALMPKQGSVSQQLSATAEDLESQMSRRQSFSAHSRLRDLRKRTGSSTATQKSEGGVTGAVDGESTVVQASNGDGTSQNTQLERHDSEFIKMPWQPIAVVSQLWLWRVEDTVVTSFPERWDSAMQFGLLEMIPNKLQVAKRDAGRRDQALTSRDIASIILTTCLEFESRFGVLGDGVHSYLDAFGDEISLVSSKVTKRYADYEDSIGRATKVFRDSVKEETELLVTIDDILTEIGMTQSVQQEQDYVAARLYSLYHNPSSSPDNHPSHGQSRPSPGENNDNEQQILMRSQWSLARQQEIPSSSSAWRIKATLAELRANASRTRDSIVTLLDLRQRQAVTENAISSEEQSRLLFIFTFITVLFAPLSWIAALLALNIDGLTLDPWPNARVFAVSFGSVLTTLALCLVIWLGYDFLVEKKSPWSEQGGGGGERKRKWRLDAGHRNRKGK